MTDQLLDQLHALENAVEVERSNQKNILAKNNSSSGCWGVSEVSGNFARYFNFTAQRTLRVRIDY